MSSSELPPAPTSSLPPAPGSGLPPAPSTEPPAPPTPKRRRRGSIISRGGIAAVLIVAAGVTVAGVLLFGGERTDRGPDGPGTLGAALVEGSWNVRGTITEARGFPAIEKGDEILADWSISSTPRGLRVLGQGFGGGYFAMDLQGEGPSYRGRATAPMSSCGGMPVMSTVTVRIRVVKGEMRSGAWRAARWTGTFVLRAPPATSGGGSCPEAGYAARLVATPAG